MSPVPVRPVVPSVCPSPADDVPPGECADEALDPEEVRRASAVTIVEGEAVPTGLVPAEEDTPAEGLVDRQGYE